MKSLFQIRQNHPVLNTCNEQVDKDIQSMLLPLNLMQYISFCPKYRIKNNVITPNSFTFIVVSMIGNLVFLFSYIYHSYSAIGMYNKTTTFITVSNYYDCIVYCLGTIINFVIGVIYTKESVKLILTFQKLHRFLNCDSDIKNSIYWNWTTVIVCISSYTIGCSCICIKLGAPLLFMYVYLLGVFFDFNILYATRVLKMLETKIVQWNLKILNTLNIEDTTENHYNKEILKAYVGILECYEIHKKCFQLFVSTFLLIKDHAKICMAPGGNSSK